MGLVLPYIVVQKSGRCDYRRYFPAPLVPFVPGHHKLVKRSLGKVDDPNFDQQHRAAAKEYDRLFTIAVKARDNAYDRLDAPTIAWLAETFVSEELQTDDEARWDPNERELYRSVQRDLKDHGTPHLAGWQPDDPLRWAAKTRETASWSLDHHRGLRAAGDLEGICSGLQEDAELLLEAHGYVVDPSDVSGIQSLCRALNDACIRVAEAKLQRLDGMELPTAAPPSKPTEDAVGQNRSKTKVPLLGTFDAYAVSQGLSAGVRATR